MQQLWLNKKRIDSIRQLRMMAKDAARDEDTLEALCAKLLDLCKDGTLRAWLTRQEEAAGGNLDPKAEPVRRAFQVLSRENSAASAVHGALAALTELPETCFAAERVNKIRSEAETERNERLKILRAHDWWPGHRETFELLKEKEWPLVVTDQVQLELAVERLRAAGQDRRTLYICNTDAMRGRWYELNLIHVRNVTIVGIENPRVKYARFAEERRIDLKAQGIRMEELTVYYNETRCLSFSPSDHKNFEFKKY